MQKRLNIPLKPSIGIAIGHSQQKLNVLLACGGLGLLLENE